MEKKRIVFLVGVVAIFLVSMVFALQFSDITQSNFNLGSYSNTTYNGEGVILSGNNLTGTFTSRIFDATSVSRWDNFTLNYNLTTKEYLYAADAQGKIYSSSNQGVTWTLINSSYGRTTDGQDMFSDSSRNLYIISNSNKEVWKSSNSGVTWINVNDTFSNLGLLVGGSDSGYIYAIAGTSAGKVFRSSNQGVTWTLINDSYNGGNGAARGMTNLVFNTNLTFQVRNCSSADCSDGIWQTANLNNINLTGRYFQYKSFFSSQEAGMTPELFNVTLDYDIINRAPSISIVLPVNTSYNAIQTLLNYTVSDVDGNLQSCKYSLNNGASNTTVTCGNNITGLTSQQGSNIWKIWANDSYGLENYSQVTFFVDSIFPVISYGHGVENNNTSFRRNWIYLNISITETNFKNVTFSLFNLTTGVNRTTFDYLVYNINFTELLDGNYYYHAEICDVVGNCNSTETRKISLDNTAPVINIVLPEAKTYGYNTSIPFNFSVYDASEISACWYALDGTNATITNCQNTTFNATEGSHILVLYVNDSLGNLGMSTRTFSVNTNLAVDLEFPDDNLWLNYNNIEFNYSVSTIALINNCSLYLSYPSWHLNQTNYSINTTGGINRFYLNLEDRSYIWNVLCADSYSAFALNNFTLNIDSVQPALAINSPLNNTAFVQNISIPLNFTVSDTNLQNCWYSLNGRSNSTISCINGQNNISFGYTAGNYNLTIYANDSANNIAYSRVYNITIGKDIVAPNLVIAEPIGTKTAKTNIPLIFTASDNVDSSQELTCWYNVTRTLTGTIEKANTFISCGQSSSFSVDLENTDYIIYLSAIDRTQNLNITISNFTVSTSGGGDTGGSSGGTGGGGGGGSYNPNISISSARVEFVNTEDVIMNPGESRTIQISLKNTGKTFLNKCKIGTQDEYKDLFESSEIKNINIGEIAEFILKIKAPDETPKENPVIKLECLEKSFNIPIKIILLDSGLRIEIKEIEVNKKALSVNYSVFSNSDFKKELRVRVIDSDDRVILEKNESLEIRQGSEAKMAYLDLNDVKSGLLKISIGDGERVFAEKLFIYNNRGLTGLAILDRIKGSATYIIILVIIFLVVATFIIRRIVKTARTLRGYR